jgi:hypothetical protein
MSNKNQQVGFIFSQTDDLTKLAIVVPTQTAKAIFHWAILPLISSSLIWATGILPTANSQQQPHHPPRPEQTQPLP